jgi:hypothetical protein
MSGRFVALCLVAAAGLLAAAPAAFAQGSTFSQAVLSLPSRRTPAGREVDDARLFAGRIRAVITDQTGIVDDFDDADLIAFRIVPRDASIPTPSGVGFTRDFVGTRVQFEEWARANAADLLRVLFPAGLSSGAAGRDVAGFYAQQFMLTTILDTDETQTRGRFGAGGLFESEWLRRDGRASGDSGWGIQGVYGLSHTMSLQARFGRQQESLRTTATNVAFDYHPFIERGTTTKIRVGTSMRGGFLYSSSRSASALEPDPLRVGSIDYGGGGWASARRRFSQLTVGGGAMLQATKSYTPPGEDGTFRNAFANALNDRGVAYDLTLGATARYDATNKLSLIGRVAETYALESSIERPATHLVLGGVMFALAPGASVDVGYRMTSFGDIFASSVFFQGNFGW